MDLPHWYQDWFFSLGAGELLWYLGIAFVLGGVVTFLLRRAFDRFLGDFRGWID